MKVLLVWEEIGLEGRCDLYLLSRLSDEDLDLLDRANGKLINDKDVGDEEPMLKVWDYITDEGPNSAYPDDPNNGKWKDRKLKIKNDKPVINESVNRVYVCGVIA